MRKPEENKSIINPSSQGVKEAKNVRIRMKPGRTLAGIAGPEDSTVVDRRTADYLIFIGYAEEEQEHDNK